MRSTKKVQINFSVEYDVYQAIRDDCAYQGLTLSQYIQYGIGRLGPLTYELAQEIRMHSGAGEMRYKYLEARKVINDRLGSEIAPPVPHKAY